MNKLFKWLLTLFLGILFFLPTFTVNSLADTESEVKKQQEKAVKLKNLQKEIEQLQKEIKAEEKKKQAELKRKAKEKKKKQAELKRKDREEKKKQAKLKLKANKKEGGSQEKKIKEIDQMFTSGLLSKEECIKFKKVILGENSKVSCGADKTKSVSVKKTPSVIDPVTVLDYVNELGQFVEPAYYPEGMLEAFGKSCIKFHCRAKKATQKMSKIFKRKGTYFDRHGGAQLYGMAYFELFYLNSLKKNTKRIDKFLENWPEKKGTKGVISVLKLNKSRKKMREALGMDMNTPVEEAMMRFWTLGDFLNQGKANKREVSKEIKQRRKLLVKYKKAISSFNTALKSEGDENLYNEILRK